MKSKTTKLILLFCFIALVLYLFHIYRPKQTPEEVLGAFLSPSGISKKADYYTGEMLSYSKNEPTLGQLLSPDVQVSIRPLSKSFRYSAFSIALTKEDITVDWYAFLVREGGRWKLEALRSLARTGIPTMLLEELEQKPQRNAEEQWDLQNLKLRLKCDAELKQFVLSNIQQLNNIVSSQMTGKTEVAQTAAKELFIDSIGVHSDGCIKLIIGGMVDDTVGFIYVPEGKTPPPITPGDYIYVEHVKDGWYVFKTT